MSTDKNNQYKYKFGNVYASEDAIVLNFGKRLSRYFIKLYEANEDLVYNILFYRKDEKLIKYDSYFDPLIVSKEFYEANKDNLYGCVKLLEEDLHCSEDEAKIIYSFLLKINSIKLLSNNAEIFVNDIIKPFLEMHDKLKLLKDKEDK